MEVEEVIKTLVELSEDPSIPKNVKSKITTIIEDMKSQKDLSLRVNKSLSELDDINNDANLPTFIRTQIWGIVSMLEQCQ